MKFRTLLALSALVGSLGNVAQAADSCDAAKGREIRPIEPASFVEKFFHRITYRALEAVGYKVAQPAEAEYATIHLAVAQGDADFTASHWRTLHADFYKNSGGEAKMTLVGTPVENAFQGYLVDKASYDAGVHNLADLKNPEIAKRFDANGDGKADLAGCMPGWGCEAVIEKHLTKLGLRDTVEHNQGSYDAIMADEIARFQEGKPIVYFTWVPYWVSAVLVPGRDVEWISVPEIPGEPKLNDEYQGKTLGFGIENDAFLVNNEFLKDNPVAKAVFEAVDIDLQDVSDEANRQRSQATIEDVDKHADEWIAAHQEEFDGWVQKGCSVSN